MDTYFNIYEKIDNIDPAELKRTAGLQDPDEVSWPKGKKYKVQLAGTECTVTTSFSGLDGRVYGSLDAYSALSTMMTRDEVEERIWKLDPNGGSDAYLYATAEFLPGLPELTEEEKEHRRAFTAAILTLLSDQKTIEYLAESAPRKKNGLFHKGRVFKIGLTGFADRYSNELLEIVGKSKDETKLTISVIGRSTSPDELEAWTHDFISTYHEGLPISEALKKVFETIGETTDSLQSKPKVIVPDFYEGLGDGTQEIDTSKLDQDSFKGVRPRYLEDARTKYEKLSRYVVDPNVVDWEGKCVYIDSSCAEVFRDKLREMGALPIRSLYSCTDYMIESLDYRSFVKRYEYLTEENYISFLGERIGIGKSIDGIIDVNDFIMWCLNGHQIKYDVSKDEHLQPYQTNKISFKKIDAKSFIKQAIQQTRADKVNCRYDWDNKEIQYCVVGEGEKAEKIRGFFNDIGKTVMSHYVEGARWSRLVLEDPNGIEEKRACAIANYNKACNEKVHIWKADDVLALIDLYGKGIKEFAEKEYYASGTLEKLIAQIMDTSQSGGAIDIKKAEKDAKNDEKAAAEAVKNALKKVNGIDFEGKTFVFAGAGNVDGVFYCYYDFNDPAIKEVIERGGIVNLKKVTGKTDYLVINTADRSSWSGHRIRDAAIQLGKRDTLKVIRLTNLLEILDETREV